MAKEKDKKYKLSKVKKAGAIIGAALILTTGGAVKLAVNTLSPSTNSNTTTTVLTNEYIDIEKINELTLYDYDENTNSIVLKSNDYIDFSNNVDDNDNTFKYAEYYELDKALEFYNNTEVNKSTDSNLLDGNGNLSTQKLINQVEENNDKLLAGKKDAITTFYTETSNEDINKICGIITEIVNSEYNNTEIKQVANTLTKLTIVNKTGSASNAYINNDLTFVYNPTMTSMYSDMQQITGKEVTEKEIIESVITHEIMHILQHENNDLNNANGLEIGATRMYNLPNQDKLVPVDSLYFPWLLEAGAELGMAEYTNSEPGTYAKKISYVRSFNLSNFYHLNSEDTAIEKLIYENDLETVFNKLNLKTEDEQMDFLKFLYSVEIIQSNPQDFWDSYKRLTGIEPTEEEQLAIRMEIRSEVVKYMTKTFYQNLADSIKDGKITDLDTVFYMMRVWEMDAYTHLEYTKETSLESAKDYILWLNDIENELFTAISNSSGITTEEIIASYDEYNIQRNINDNITDNCDLSNLNNYTQELITSSKDTYALSNFARINDMVTYIETYNDNAPIETTEQTTKGH